MTGTVHTTSPVRHVLQPGERLVVTASSISNGRVGRVANNDGGVPTSFQPVTAGQTIKVGPYPFATVHLIEAFADTLSYFVDAPPYGYAMNLGAVQGFTGSRTLRTEDNGKLLRCDDASNVTVTVPADLPEGFNVALAMWGTGTVAIAADAGATNRSGASTLSTQYNIGSVLVMKTGEFVVGGDFV